MLSCRRLSNDPQSDPTDIDSAQAEWLVHRGEVRCLDVRTPDEFVGLGHIPGAMLLPVDWIPTALGTLSREGKPILVVCEHGIRSAFAARYLARAGFEGVLNLRGGMSEWSGPRDHAPANPFSSTGPCSWLVENADLLPRSGRALDLACGGGRHAFLLGAVGLEVDAFDVDAEKVSEIAAIAAQTRVRVHARVVDLETGVADLGDTLYDIILVIHYLHRPLFPVILKALKPGGILLYETFTLDQARRGKPTNPTFLLTPGELPRLVEPLEVIRQREGDFDGRCVSAVAARRQLEH